MSRDWDAATYDRVSDPQVAWAREVLARLRLRGDETVLDAGCGTGRVTRMLLELLPDGHVLAVDAAPSMVEWARASLSDDRVTVLPPTDLGELRLEKPVDVVFSNAVFHWVPDHDALFARLYDALRPGGVVVAQCGGKGNVERFCEVALEVAAQDPFAEHLQGWAGPWNFASPEDTGARLAHAGFGEVSVWLEPRSVVPEHPEEWIRTGCLGYHLQRLPGDLGERFVHAVAEACGQPVKLDYVRLNIDATRPE